MTSTKLTYVFDAYCGWCYGFAPALHELAQDEGIDIEVISGGLFSGHHAGPIGALPHIPGANARIAALTGVRFGEAYETVLSDGTLHMDSDDAGTGLVALKEASGGKDLDMAAAMQQAFYIDGLSLSDTGTYRTIATREGLDPDVVESSTPIPAPGKRHCRNRNALQISESTATPPSSCTQLQVRLESVARFTQPSNCARH